MSEINFPITPPPELVEQWCHKWTDAHGEYGIYLATQAARWGADQELEACAAWMQSHFHGMSHWAEQLRESRRPKPPSLKEQALETLRQIPIDPEAGVGSSDLDTIRRALEQLND